MTKNLICIFSIIAVGLSCASGKLRADNPLFSNKWVLSELNGTPVQTSNTDNDASMNFSFQNKKVTGTGGCNHFNGTFSALGKDMSFGPLTSTKMMCSDIKFEDAFFAALSKVKNFEVTGNELSLKDGKTILARLIPG